MYVARLLFVSGFSSQRSELKLWNLKGELLATCLDDFFYKGRSGSPDASFSPDGQTIISVDGHFLQLWNLQGEKLDSLYLHEGHHIGAYEFVNLFHAGLDFLITESCEWLRDYLTNNPNVSASDKKLLEDIEK
jgi:WD40 repeat protein